MTAAIFSPALTGFSVERLAQRGYGAAFSVERLAQRGYGGAFSHDHLRGAGTLAEL